MKEGVYGYIATVRPVNYARQWVGLPMTIIGECHVDYTGMPESEFYKSLNNRIVDKMFTEAELLSMNIGSRQDIKAVIDFLKVKEK